MIFRILLIYSISLSLVACVNLGSQKPAPVTTYGQSSGVGSAGVHNVRIGDTLYTISTAYRLPMRDIVILNNIQAPFKLREGQRLKLPPPQEYIVRGGDTIYDVSRLFGVNSSEIARLNKIRAPYSLKEGQILRMPFMTRKTQTAAIKPKQTPVRQMDLGSVKREILSPPQSQDIEKTQILIPPEKPQRPSEMRTIKRVTGQPPTRASSKFLQPVRGEIISSFGPKKSGLHNDGINIAAPKGTPVKAAENGIVVYAGNELKGSGNLILIRHQDQWVSAYAHMDSMAVSKGDIVKRGQPIGAVGSTGSVNEPQLHFEIRRGTDAINPKKYLEE